MPPPQLRNHPRPIGSVYQGPTTPVGDSQAKARPLSSHRPTSIDRSTTTSNVNPVPVRNSSTRTPRSMPSPSVTRRTPTACSKRPTRRINSRRVSAFPWNLGIEGSDPGAFLLAASPGHADVVVGLLTDRRACGLDPLRPPSHRVEDENPDADQEPHDVHKRRVQVGLDRAVDRRAERRVRLGEGIYQDQGRADRQDRVPEPVELGAPLAPVVD